MTKEKKDIKTVIINGKEYNLHSDNSGLLLKLPPVEKWNKELRKYEKKEYDYMPINIVYQLLDGLFDGWNFTNNVFTTLWSGKSIKTVKDKNSSSDIEEYNERIMVEGILEVIIDGKIIKHTGTALGVASGNILGSDQAINGFSNKLDARLLKKLCKRLGRVFRIGEMDEADEEDITSIKDDAKIDDVKIKNDIKEKDFEKDITVILKKAIEDYATRDAYLNYVKELRKDLAIKDNSKEHKFMLELVKEILSTTDKFKIE